MKENGEFDQDAKVWLEHQGAPIVPLPEEPHVEIAADDPLRAIEAQRSRQVALKVLDEINQDRAHGITSGRWNAVTGARYHE